jgi:hypothetical protein
VMTGRFIQDGIAEMQFGDRDSGPHDGSVEAG